ncbi:hypothetical protein [Streptomyces sp. AK02-01A]|uniref:hypothetical protein n=1 Tax=Streptomyces sp. AK02-01A TaxID=3028648 RepID=UPI0029CA273B|nr:hypothetical protein [Streptomyces sp. AK02-01A]
MVLQVLGRGRHLFYFEIDNDGWVTGQVELQGPELRPVTAGRDTDTDMRYGITAESPVSE